jgi:hypothetical protein
MPFKMVIAGYSDNTQHAISQQCGLNVELLNVKGGGAQLPLDFKGLREIS